MKKLLPLLMFIMMMEFVNDLSADTPPPPPSGGHGQGGNLPPGGGARLGSGLILMLTLAAGYGGRKVFEARKGIDP